MTAYTDDLFLSDDIQQVEGYSTALYASTTFSPTFQHIVFPGKMQEHLPLWEGVTLPKKIKKWLCKNGGSKKSKINEKGGQLD